MSSNMPDIVIDIDIGNMPEKYTIIHSTIILQGIRSILKILNKNSPKPCIISLQYRMALIKQPMKVLIIRPYSIAVLGINIDKHIMVMPITRFSNVTNARFRTAPNDFILLRRDDSIIYIIPLTIRNDKYGAAPIQSSPNSRRIIISENNATVANNGKKMVMQVFNIDCASRLNCSMSFADFVNMGNATAFIVLTIA